MGPLFRYADGDSSIWALFDADAMVSALLFLNAV